jgi:hypothetical protein
MSDEEHEASLNKLGRQMLLRICEVQTASDKEQINISLETETIKVSPDTAPASKHKGRLFEESCGINSSASEICEPIAGCSNSDPTDNTSSLRENVTI